MGVGREAIEAQDRKMETTRSTVKEHKDLIRFGWWEREMKKIVSSLDAILELDSDLFRYQEISGRMTGRAKSCLPHELMTSRHYGLRSHDDHVCFLITAYRRYPVMHSQRASEFCLSCFFDSSLSRSHCF